MTIQDIRNLRLQNQRLTSPHFAKPEEVVRWFGAMQSQDFPAAKWAIALRANGQTDKSIEDAFNKGLILRTHVMRPTWHFVLPADIRWLLALTAPRVLAFSGHYFRKSGLDKEIFKKSNDIIRKNLQGGKQLTRIELSDYLQAARLPVQDLGLTFTIMQAELNGIICSGPRIGKQFTYMLLNERVPQTKEISHDEALTELTRRYFQSHGPAQLQDFVWWSGLTMVDARKGIELIGSSLYKEIINDKTYYFFPIKHTQLFKQNTFLIPGFDEYFIAYKDRSDILDKAYAKHLNQGGGMINGAIVKNGRMVGGWKRIIKSKSILMNIQLFEKITEKQQYEIQTAAHTYGKFINLPIVLNKA